MNSDCAPDAALFRDFVAECEGLMQRLTEDIAGLEEYPQDPARVDKMLLAFHTIKGSALYFKCSEIADPAREAERVLTLLHRGESQVTRQTIDALLTALHRLQEMLLGIRGVATPMPQALSGPKA